VRCVCLLPFVITQSDDTVETGAGSTHTRDSVRACVVTQGTQGSGRGRNTRSGGGDGGGAALGSASSECSGLWLAKYKQIASQSPG